MTVGRFHFYDDEVLLRLPIRIQVEKRLYHDDAMTISSSSESDECTNRYNNGNTSNVNNVDDKIPPMTMVANGRCTSAPVPVASTIGTNPGEATSAVINTGRRRVMAPSKMALSSERPSSRRVWMKSIIARPFNTATPDSAMKPTAAEMIDSGMPHLRELQISHPQ
jgi:hypothetical protein